MSTVDAQNSHDKGEITSSGDSSTENQNNQSTMRTRIPKRSYITLFILVYINLLNYMDRYTVSSVLPDIQKWFNIDKTKAGLLQTIFVCSYMVFAPLFGYLGDRFSRKYVMAIGITIWSATTFLGSLMGKKHFWGFFAFRGLVGIGEASYSTVAPTIIADLFIGDRRSKALSLFYFAIPCGSGLGYIVGSKVSGAFGGENSWQWALRVTPVLGAIAVLLVLIAVYEPPRGALDVQRSAPENVDELSQSTVIVQEHSYKDDLKKILRVPSFNWATFGYTCVSFTIGALAWWSPEFGLYSMQVLDKKNQNLQVGDVSYIFGIVTFVAGVVGVTLGAETARRLRHKTMEADALVCGIGILGAIPFVFFTLYTFDKLAFVPWVLLAIGEILLFLNWAPNGDLLLYVIPPSCRSSAEAIQIVLLHLLGDAFSPFVIGAIADAYTAGSKDIRVKQLGLLYALYVTPFICCFGGFAYLICGRYLAEDKRKADEEALVEADIPPTSVLDSIPAPPAMQPPPMNPPVDRGVVPDIYNHIEPDSDSDGYDDEGDEDTTNLIPETKIVR